jgi:cobalt-zinc-cadmium efflux system membrane fusion protein
MNRLLFLQAAVCAGLLLLNAACEKQVTAQDSGGGASRMETGPVPTTVRPEMDANHFRVEHPEQFPLATAVEHIAAPELNVTGSVNPDVSRQVPVPALATGRITEINARLGDAVQKNQLLFKIQSTDIAGAYSDYRKAVKNEQLAKIQLNRAKILFEDGAIPKSALETAQVTEDNALVDLQTAIEHLRLLGADPDHPSGIVEVHAPVSGIITDQQIAISSGVQAWTPPNPFTISDLSHVWIVCDVYENDMAQVHLGEFADIHLAAYPNRVLKGRIGNILPVMDPSIRTTKVRLEVENPGILRLGMFVTATFHGSTAERRAAVPATAILHLHDREWVYTPNGGGGGFRRQEVVAGSMLPNNMQEIVSGIQPGDEVVANALVFQNTVEQ